MNQAQFNAQVRPVLDQWIATREPHEAAYLNQLFEQESGFSPFARSGTGAAGLGQITRGTWQDIVSYAARNIPAEELPGDLTYTDLEADDSYDTHVTRPFANAFMSWANIKRLESFALDGINDKRLRLSDANEPVTDLISALDGDPRKWAMVVGAGHKDGMGRMELFTDDRGDFTTEPARKFYRERKENFQTRSRALANQADIERQSGNVAEADRLGSRARALAVSDSTGHVFGFGDRLATAVATNANLPPLEFTADEYADFVDLRAPGHTNANPAVARFATALEALDVANPLSGQEGDQVAGAGVPAPEVPFRNTLTDAVGRALTAITPEVAANADLPPLPAGTLAQQDEDERQSALDNESPGRVLTPEQLIASPEFNALIGNPTPVATPQTPQEQANALADSPAFSAVIAGQQPPTQALVAATTVPGTTPVPAQTSTGVPATSEADALAVFDSLIDRAISNQLGNTNEVDFNARAGALRDARDLQAGNLRNQAATALQARFNVPVSLPNQADSLAVLEAGGPQGDQVGQVLRSFNTPINAPQISGADINSIASFINNDGFGGFQRAAGNQVLGGLSDTQAAALSGVPLPFQDFGINDNALRNAQLQARAKQAEAQQFRELSGIETNRIGLAEQTEINRLILEGITRGVQQRRDEFGL